MKFEKMKMSEIVGNNTELKRCCKKNVAGRASQIVSHVPPGNDVNTETELSRGAPAAVLFDTVFDVV